MLSHPRHYRDERNLARMYALLQAGRAAANDSYYGHVGDLKWWLYYPPLGASCEEHIYLWEDLSTDDRLLGWALLDPCGETFDVFCHPEVSGSALAEEMHAWAEESLIPIARAAGRE
jgi:hypothetical protein